MSAALEHNDLFRYGPESEAEPVAAGIKQVVLGTNGQLVQSKSWYERGARKAASAKPKTVVSYVLDGFFEIQVAGKTQVLGPSGSFIVPSGTDHEIKCLEDGILLGVFASESSASDARGCALNATSKPIHGRDCVSRTTSSTQFD